MLWLPHVLSLELFKETGGTNPSLLKWHEDSQESLSLCPLKQIGLVSQTLRKDGRSLAAAADSIIMKI